MKSILNLKAIYILQKWNNKRADTNQSKVYRNNTYTYTYKEIFETVLKCFPHYC